MQSHVLKISADHAYLGETSSGPVPGGYSVRAPWRSLYSDRYETVLVSVRDGDGYVGWGEALSPVGPEVVGTIVDRLIAPYLMGRVLAGPRSAWFAMQGLMRERGHLGGHQADALAAVDMALWDLAGRRSDRSVGDLLGGAVRDRVPTYVSGLPSPDPGKRREMARQWSAAGATRLKLHLGFGITDDLATLDSILNLALPLRIAVDAHWAYSYPEALQLARELADRGCWFLEAPLAPEDRDGHANLVERSEVPIAVGEVARHRYEVADWVARGAVSILQPDVARTGLTEALAMADIASAHHVRIAPHHSVCSGLAFAAGVHLAALVPELVAMEYQPFPLRALRRVVCGADDLVGGQLPGDSVPVPQGPGLGVEIDEDYVREVAQAC